MGAAGSVTGSGPFTILERGRLPGPFRLGLLIVEGMLIGDTCPTRTPHPSTARAARRLVAAMRDLGIVCLSASLALAASASVSSQRAAMVGLVLDAAGERVADAEVLLVHRVLRFAIGVDDAELPGDDVLRARTGPDGRFRIEALEGRGYSGFAWWTDVDQRQHVTVQQEDLVAGSPFDLRESVLDVGSPPQRIAVEELAIWEFLGPLRFRALPELAHPVALPVEVEEWSGDRDAPCQLVLPPLPGHLGALEILTAEGEVLHRFRVGGGTSDGARATVTMPPPARFRLRAVDAASGASISGAVVRVRSADSTQPIRSPVDRATPVRSTWRVVGTTGEFGTMTCRVPVEEGQPHEARFLITAPGRAVVHAGWSRDTPYVSGRVVPDPEEGLLVVPLPEAEPVHGVLVDRAGMPLGGVPVVLRTQIRLSMRKSALSWDGPGHFATTDAEGRFEFAGVARHAATGSLFVVSPPAAREDPSGAAWPDPELVGTLAKAVDLTKRRDLRTIEMGLLQEIRVEVLDTEGRPVRGARVDTFSVDFDPEFPEPHAWTDGRGRARLRVDPAADPVVLVTHPSAGFAGVVPVDSELQVRLGSLLELMGRAVDLDGRPVKGARVTMMSRGRRLARAAPPDADFRLQEVYASLNENRTARADLEGRFVVRLFPAIEQRFLLGISAGGLGGSLHVDPELVKEALRAEGPIPASRRDLGDVVLLAR